MLLSIYFLNALKFIFYVMFCISYEQLPSNALDSAPSASNGHIALKIQKFSISNKSDPINS